jgi:hypothetical protein
MKRLTILLENGFGAIKRPERSPQACLQAFTPS